jgi:hypothetical protein
LKRERFGEVAVRLGYVQEAQVAQALARQRALRAEGEDRLIGLVMLDLGLINNFQLVNVLKEMDKKTTGHA